MFKFKLGFIGFGNMAQAITNGIILKGLLLPSEMMCFDVDKDKLNYAKKLSINAAATNQEVFESCENIILAIKPQQAFEVLDNVKSFKNILISIMAGVKKDKIKKALPDCQVVRCMPNSPALVGCGMTAIDCSGIPLNKKEFVLSVFSSIGETQEIDENLMDAVTAVSGSGPAYVYIFLDALINAGVKNGLDYNVSKKLALKTLIGSATVVEKTDLSIDDLTNSVCSKGGTTIEAINVFNENEFQKIIAKAVDACYKRSKELSKL